MLQTAILIVLAFLSIGYSFMQASAQSAQLAQLTGDVAATSFMNYRQSVANYLVVNPATNGTVAYGSLSVPTGYIQNTQWTHLITGGQLYVYSTVPPSPAMIDAVYQKSNQYIMVGVKLANTNLSGPRGVVTASLPAAIPTGSIVYVGS